MHKDINSETFKEMVSQKEILLLDVRTPLEFEAGHIEGAINIDFYHPEFPDDLNSLDKETVVLIYCRTGNRSGKAMQMMRNMGFKEVYNLEEGIVDWAVKGHKIVKGENNES